MSKALTIALVVFLGGTLPVSANTLSATPYVDPGIAFELDEVSAPLPGWLVVDTRTCGNNVTLSQASFPVWWIVRWLFSSLASYALGKGLDYAFSRSQMRSSSSRAASHVAYVQSQSGLSYQDRQTLERLERYFRDVERVLVDMRKSEAEMQSDIRHLYEQVAGLDQRIEALEQKLVRLEQEQQRQLRMIVDNTGRIVALERRMDRVEDDVDDLEEAVYPKRNTFPRFKVYLSGALLYATASELDDAAKLGYELLLQYNINSRIGARIGYINSPFVATNAIEATRKNSPIWHNEIVMVGMSVSLLPPAKPVTIHLGASGGLASHQLYYFLPDENEYDLSEGFQIGEKDNLAFALHGDLAVSPLGWWINPFVSASTISFKDEIRTNWQDTEGNPSPVEAGKRISNVSFGLRVRF